MVHTVLQNCTVTKIITPPVLPAGNLILLNMTEELEGDYSCVVRIRSTGQERTVSTTVLIMPDIVLTKSKKIFVDEGGNFTLKCDVLPGVNAKIMWKKDGELVLPSSEAGMHVNSQIKHVKYLQDWTKDNLINCILI